MFENHNTLGFVNPFYITIDNKNIIKKDPNELYKIQSNLILDPIAVIQMLNYQYFFGDRTLVNDIKKTPFFATPTNDMRDWKFENVPNHSERNDLSEEEVALKLFSKIKLELNIFCNEANTVGILLSGGMDSRIIAGTLDNLIKEKELNCHVVAITWGDKKSRDVVYASKIAKILEWDWIHFDITLESLIENIKFSAERGCEYAPNHLHAMPEVSKVKGLDCIIAGSFGDSIGRGEYSGKHFSTLPPLGSKTKNKFSLIKSHLYEMYKNDVNTDIEYYNNLFPRDHDFQIYELQRQIHYMRRMLNPCMNVINEKIPLFQVFTTPETFGFMWSLDKGFRNDYIYYYLLQQFDKGIQNIPWARTGKLYLKEESKVQDELNSSYNKYGKWVRNDLYHELREKVLSSNIENLNIFNMDALESVIKYNSKMAYGDKHNRADEIILWLASLSEFNNENRLTSDFPEKVTIKDSINAHFNSVINISAYNLGRRLFR